jgi:hypothetical protein
MDSFWAEFLEKWGNVRTWVKTETKLAGLYQKELTVIDFWIRFRDLAQKANYPPNNNPTLCGLFCCKLSYCIQNHWTQPGSPEVQFFSIKAVFEHTISIEQTLNETATCQTRRQASLTTCVHPARTASAKAPTLAPDSAPQSNAAATFDITKVRCYNCEGKSHFAKDCPKPKKPRKAKVAAVQSESDVELQLEQAMNNLLQQLETKASSLSVRGSEKTTTNRNKVRLNLILDQDPPNPNAAPKKLTTGPRPPASGTLNSGPSSETRPNQMGLSVTNEPLPCPAASKVLAASASNEDIVMEEADADRKKAEHKLQARLDLLQKEFTELNKQVSIATCSPISGAEKNTGSTAIRPCLASASRTAWKPAPLPKTVIFSNTGTQGQMAMRATGTGKGRIASPLEGMKIAGMSNPEFLPLKWKMMYLRLRVHQ